MQDFSFHNWEKPLPIMEGYPILEWPQNSFPKIFEDFVKELSRSTETPIEMSAMLIMAIVSATAQKKFKVLIKEDYQEPLNIWPMIVLPPASRKSRVYSEVTYPFREWETEQKKLKEPVIQSIISKRKTIEIRLKELRTKAAKVQESKLNEIQREIENLELNMPEVPSIPQLWTSDVTPEHLGTIMSLNEESMTVMSDEGGIFDILGGLYSDGKANIDLFLQAHAASPTRVDRGSRPPIFMNSPTLTMALTIQPTVLKTICRNRTFRGRGLLGRFLYIFPKSNIGQRSLEVSSINITDVINYRLAVRTLLDKQFGASKRNEYQLLKMSEKGYLSWLQYAKNIEKSMGEDGGHLNHITDWAGKLAGTIARLAGIIHIMRYVGYNAAEYEISEEDVKASIKIGYCLTNHALNVFDLISEENCHQDVVNLYQWIVRENLDKFTLRECKRKFRSFSQVELSNILKLLEESDIIRQRQSAKSPGRPSHVYEVNPYLFT